MNKSESIGALAAALAKVQAVIEGAKKDSDNPFFHSKYADLTSVWEACRKPLADNGLSVVQGGVIIDGLAYLETMLTHSSGEWISGLMPMKAVKKYSKEERARNPELPESAPTDDPQALVAASTYMRRAGLAAIVGVAPEDDDGNAASGKPKVGTQAAANYVRDEKLKAAGFGDKHDALKAEMETKHALDHPETNPFSGEAYVQLPISDKQSKRLYAIAKSNNWTDEEMKKALKDGWEISHTKEIKGKKLYETICAFFEGGKKDAKEEVDPFALEPDDGTHFEEGEI